jgi:hypothetical protein
VEGTVTPHACLPRHTPSFSNPNRLLCHRALTARCPFQIPLLRVRCRPRIRYVLARVSPSTVVVSNRSLSRTRHVLWTVGPDGSVIHPPPTPSGTGAFGRTFRCAWHILVLTTAVVLLISNCLNHMHHLRQMFRSMVWNHWFPVGTGGALQPLSALALNFLGRPQP